MTSYEHKVKNIYLGAWEQTIEVDWTTLSALPTWWTVWNQTPTYNWWLKYTSSSSTASNWLLMLYQIPTNSKKITLENNWNHTTNNTYAWRDIFWITNNLWWWPNTESRYNALCHFVGFWYNDRYEWLRYTTQNSDNDLISAVYWSNGWNFNQKLEIDFDTWNVKISSTAPYSYEKTTTLSSSILNDVKTHWYIMLLLEPANSQTATIYNTSIKIER